MYGIEYTNKSTLMIILTFFPLNISLKNKYISWNSKVVWCDHTCSKTWYRCRFIILFSCKAFFQQQFNFEHNSIVIWLKKLRFCNQSLVLLICLMLVRHRRGSLSHDTDSNHMRASRFLTGVDGISEIKFKIC